MEKILFFDGVCVMCNSLIGFAFRHDKLQKFKFAPLQGETAQKHIPKFAESELKTVVLMDEKGVHTESDAIIRLLIGLGGIFKIAGVFWIVPRSIRNWCYRLVANNRYRWFGKTESCAMLSRDQRARLLD